MISVAEAQDKIAALVPVLGWETVPLAKAGGRVLAEAVTAHRAQPPFAASAMDGYAIQVSDRIVGQRLRVVGAVAAGETPRRAIGSGETMRIFTGAPLPDGANAILIQEDVIKEGNDIIVSDGFDSANYVRPAGGDFPENFDFNPKRRLTPADIALLAAMNVGQVSVIRQPVIAIIPTGDELVWPGETPRPDQIIASNNFGLKLMLESEGAIVRLMPIAPDRTDSLARSLANAEGADMIVTMGGASVGDHDLVQSVAGSQGLDLSFYKLAMRPGKPLMAGQLGNAVMVGLPGNPVSSLVCGHIFLRPAIAAFQGLGYTPPLTQIARLGAPLGPNGPREHYMRAKVDRVDNELICIAAERQDSSLLTVLADANALLIRPPYDTARAKGDEVCFSYL